MITEFVTLPDLVAIHGAPRSGTTWLGQIFNSSEHVAFRYQPLFSYAFKGRLTDHSDAQQISDFVRDLAITEDDFILQRGSASLAGYSLDFQKSEISHLIYKEVRYHEVLENLLERWPNARVIGLLRNPCAVINSWIRAPREFNPEWSVLEEWRSAPSKNEGAVESYYGFEGWKRVAHLFDQLQSKFPDRFLLARYEALVAAPLEEVTRLFSFCGLPMSIQVSRFVERSTSKDDHHAYGVFRKRRMEPSWPLELDAYIAETIHAELCGTRLERYLSNPGL